MTKLLMLALRMATRLRFTPADTEDLKIFRDYVGRYEVSPKLIMTIKTDGRHLYLKGTGGYFLGLQAAKVSVDNRGKTHSSRVRSELSI